MRKIIQSLFLIMIASTLTFAGTETTDPNIAFKAPDEIQGYATGFEVAGFGGLDVAQDGAYKRQFGTHFYDQDPASKLGWTAGLKVGYTWPGWGKGPGFSDDPVNSIVDGRSFTVLPAYEMEFFYLNHQQLAHDASAVTAGSTSANLNGYVFSGIPVLRAQIGMFRPYIGIGPGFAYLERANAHFIAKNGVQGQVFGNQSDGVLALQFEAGTDVFITPNISLFGEYKLVNFVDPSFTSGGGYFATSQVVNDEFVSLGVRYHF